eukprot:c17189_g1_i1 orf=372-1841(+)
MDSNLESNRDIEDGTKKVPENELISSGQGKDEDHELGPTTGDQQEIPTLTQPKTKRIATLDVFRGLTIAMMVIADDAGGEWGHLNHSPWNGCTFADFVMPFFLFIVGVSIALALKKIPKVMPAVKKVIIRTIKLILWGLILQGGYSHAPDDLTYGVDMTKIRWCGILQRIALAYLVVALIEIATTKTRSAIKLQEGFLEVFKFYKWHWLAALCVMIIYFSCVYGIYVPDWQFESPYNGNNLTVTCGVRGHFDEACNAVGHVDRKILGFSHLYTRPEWTRAKPCDIRSPNEADSFREGAPAWCYAPFDPEGILSSISSILSTILGIHYGHVLINFKDHPTRLKHWTIPGFVLSILGIILHYSHAIYLNKQLYSFSYVCLTGGVAGLVFTAVYILIDIYGVRRPTLLLEWMGMNAMFVFVMAASGIFPAFINGWYYKTENNTLVYWIQKHIFIKVWHSRRVGILLYVLFGEVLFWGIVSGILHWQGMYWKL